MNLRILDWKIKNIVLFSIILAVLVNFFSFIEAIMLNTNEGKYVITITMLILTIYILILFMSGNIANRKKKLRYKKLAYLSILALLIMEFFNRLFGLYSSLPNVDIVAHILGGIAVVSVIYIVSKFNFKSTVILSLLAIIIWELGEIIFDFMFPLTNSELYRDPFLYDGLFDIIFHIVGMTVVLFVIKKLNLTSKN